MISLLAREDLQDLRDEGLQPTDEDVIRLHALALRVSDGPETTAACAPRFAICGGLVIWEPTLAAWDWYKYAKTFAGEDAVEEMMFAFACVHGRERGYLENLRDPAEIEKTIGTFIGTMTATKAEITRAVNYVVMGYDDVVPEKTELAKKREAEEDERIKDNYSFVEAILTRAASATGLTYEDIMIQTPSRLNAMIYNAKVLAGMKMSESSSRAHADYLATLHAIRKRLTEEKSRATGADKENDQDD